MGVSVVYWLILFIVLLIIEISTVSLISIWFCLGALAAMAVSFFGAGIEWQLFVFAVVSLITLILTRPVVRRFKKSVKPTNVNALIGVETYAVEDIDNNKGEIKINDVVWSARSVDGTPIAKGERVVVESIKGVKAYVRKIN